LHLHPLGRSHLRPSVHPSAKRKSGEAEKWRSGKVEKRTSASQTSGLLLRLDKVLRLNTICFAEKRTPWHSTLSKRIIVEPLFHSASACLLLRLSASQTGGEAEQFGMKFFL
jgi:hypothetical protein